MKGLVTGGSAALSGQVKVRCTKIQPNVFVAHEKLHFEQVCDRLAMYSSRSMEIMYTA